jgi:thioredoxin reductase (NADPH)
MIALATTFAFCAVTGALMAIHLRRSACAEPAAPAASCPRCRAAVPEGSDRCPQCGVPQQIYEIVSAQTVIPEEEPAKTDGEIAHAVVRADKCLGCGTCVGACPEPGAIFLQGKLAIIDTDLCKGHGACVQACPIGAITLGAGAAVQRVEVPEVDADFQSNVPGVYIVGELGGRGLIKNAINEGRIAIEAVMRETQPGAHRDAAEDVYDVAIVGSGPAGLSAGLEAHRAGLRYVILEQGTPADTIRKYPRHKLLLAEPISVPLYGDLWVADASKEDLIRVWEAVIANTGLVIRTDHRVEELVREGEIFRVRTSQGEYRARRVVLAIGRRGTPRRLGAPGEELAKVVYDIVEMDAFAGRRVLVVGGGDSAVESALGLSNQKDAVVHLAYRGREFSRVKERNRVKLDEATAAGRVKLLLETDVVRILEEEVVLSVAGREMTLPNDNVIIRVGGEPPSSFLERAGVRIVQKDVPLVAA